MEVEDPISAKFQTLVESLMAKTTSEIVKVFTEVLLETRVEISRSWREIDELKKKLEEAEEKRTEAYLRSEAIIKTETEEAPVSHESSEFDVVNASSLCPVDRESENQLQIPKGVTSEHTGITQSDVADHEPLTSQTIPGISGINESINGQSINGQKQAPVAQTSQTVKRNRGRPSKSAKRLQKLKTSSVIDPQESSSGSGIIILSKNRDKERAVITKKKYIQKSFGSIDNITTTHQLRDRQHLGNQRLCLCVSSDHCSQTEKQLKYSPQEASQLYPCRKCGKKFNEWLRFQDHKCSTVLECNRCGQTFRNMKHLSTHRQSVESSTRPFQYCCYHCDLMFATQCGWNIHKRIHVHSNDNDNTQQDATKKFQSLTLDKELNAKVEVRLERISHAQLEAALCPKESLQQDETPCLSSKAMVQCLPSAVHSPASSVSSNAPSTSTVTNKLVSSKASGFQAMTKDVLGSRSETGIGENGNKLDGKNCNSVIPPVSSKVQPKQKEKVDTEDPADTLENEVGSSGRTSLSRKRKVSDCNHDEYNGVFPVEKILRWRTTKGRNEVRVKWMPCSLCGTKWKNTWEPAESFTSYKDSMEDEK